MENLQNIRTVVTYGAQEAAVAQYDRNLDGATRAGIWDGVFGGGLSGFINAAFFWTYAVSLW